MVSLLFKTDFIQHWSFPGSAFSFTFCFSNVKLFHYCSFHFAWFLKNLCILNFCAVYINICAAVVTKSGFDSTFFSLLLMILIIETYCHHHKIVNKWVDWQNQPRLHADFACVYLFAGIHSQWSSLATSTTAAMSGAVVVQHAVH